MRKKRRKIVYIDMDGVLCDFVARYKEMKKLHSDVEYPQSMWGFFSKLKPIKKAIKAYKKLQKRGYIVKILTRPSIKNLNCYSEKADWVKTYLGEAELENLQFACDKSFEGMEFVDYDGYLIDDDTKNGQTEFPGEHIHFGQKKFPNWKTVLDYLK